MAEKTKTEKTFYYGVGDPYAGESVQVQVKAPTAKAAYEKVLNEMEPRRGEYVHLITSVEPTELETLTGAMTVVPLEEAALTLLLRIQAAERTIAEERFHALERAIKAATPK